MSKSYSEQSSCSSSESEEEIDTYLIEFIVRKSIRYHSKRKAFFENLHNIASILTAILGSIAFGTLLAKSQTIAQVFTGVVVLISALDFTIGFSKKTDLYTSLYRRFSDLLIKITIEPAIANNLKKWNEELFLIQKDEPEALSVLNVFCHNEECIGQGRKEETYIIPCYMILTKNFISWDCWQPKKHKNTCC